MTTLIRQRSGNDCVLAAIAMAAGKSRWEDLWTDADLQSVIESKGVSNVEHWLGRAGYEQNKDYVVIYCRNESSIAKAFLWKRRALLSVDSLNNVGGSHMVFWDGNRIYDPHEDDPGYLFHRIITGCSITRVFMFAT